MGKEAPKKRRTKLYIGVILAIIVVVSVVLIGLFYNPFDVQLAIETKPERINTTLTIDVPSAVEGKPVMLQTILEDENGDPIQNVDIDYQIYEDGSWKEIGFAKTDSSGNASMSYTPLTKGTFQVKAIFKETIDYAQSSSTVATLDVGISFGQLDDYVQQLEDGGFEVFQGTWSEPQFYTEIPDLENFIGWAEKAREQHRQRAEDDPLIYVDVDRSVFWFIGRIALFTYDDVTFYWFV